MGVDKVNPMSAEHKSFLIVIKGSLQRPSAQIHFSLQHINTVSFVHSTGTTKCSTICLMLQ